jgi:squalene-hopene/tetraprenyl-beta-curcumene cyclase
MTSGARIVLLTLILSGVSAGQTAGPESRPAAAPGALARELLQRGAQYLLSAQASDGGWASDKGPGVSCLVLKALIQTPDIGPEHPAVQRGIQFVLRAQRSDGGIYGAQGLLKNYESSVALSMLATLSDERYRKPIDALQNYLKELQWDEGEGRSIDDAWYGGAGYGYGKRPDLSNTQMMLEALHDSGLPASDPVYQKALLFISRCQMLGEKNDQPLARGATDGGFIYSPANGGESKAGEWMVNGRKELRSYGSMTYSGYKSLLYAGVDRNDPRVRAAQHWIARHWTLDFNPNMPERRSAEGLYYYYHVFARALAAGGDDRIRDAAGAQRDWRRELTEKLARSQRSDGSWVNPADRWFEGIPALTTAYAMLALQAANP